MPLLKKIDSGSKKPLDQDGYSKGAALNGPETHLEGSGKLHRHLKLKSVSDISAKDAKSFLMQVL